MADGEDDRAGEVAPGWDAIEAALQRVHGDQAPLHLAAVVPYALGGPDPLDGLSAYLHASGHWHYVSLGLSELYAKQSDQPDTSGWGFELTLRLRHQESTPPQRWCAEAPPPPAAQPPRWPFLFLQQLARQVFEHAAIIRVHDCLRTAPADAAGLAGFVAALDPELGDLATANGQLRFLQLVGLDAAQLARADASPTAAAALLAELRAASPLLVTQVP